MIEDLDKLKRIDIDSRDYKILQSHNRFKNILVIPCILFQIILILSGLDLVNIDSTIVIGLGIISSLAIIINPSYSKFIKDRVISNKNLETYNSKK